jgi:hypothetical protein
MRLSSAEPKILSSELLLACHNGQDKRQALAFTLQSSGPELVGTRSTPLDGPVDGPGFCSLPFCTVVGVVAGMVCPEDEVEDL